MTTRLSARHLAEALDLPCPTPEQQAVVEAPLAATLVVAGAGSGKTETMTSRVVWLVANRLVTPEQVLGLTFTRKAAGELAERVRRRLDALARSGLWTPPTDEDGTPVLGALPTISTYHAYAGRLVAEHGLRLGVEPDAHLLGEAAAWQLASDVVARFDGPLDDVARALGKPVPAASTLVDAVLQLSGELAEHLVGVHDLEGYLARIDEHLTRMPDTLDATSRRPPAISRAVELAANVRLRRATVALVRAYADAKARREVLDFADQMALAARLAREEPEVATLERRRFRVVLLDEFQDTSEAQLVLLQGLFATGLDAAPVMAVGDPNQSIYGWRGASATTLTRFPDEFSWAGRPAQVLSLSTSWRNDEIVLAAANAVAAPLRADAAVPVAELGARSDAGPGRLDVRRAQTLEDEARLVARWIDVERVRHGHVRSSAVLCRKRSQFEHVVEALEELGLPVELVGLGGLLRASEVLDLVALLTVVDDPTRGDHLVRLLAGPAVRLGARDLAALASWSGMLRHQAAMGPRGRMAPGDREVLGAGPPAGSVPADGPPVDPTLDPVGLVEALSELPPPSWVGADGRALSDVGRARLTWLAGVVDGLRASAGAGLPELVLEARRALGLDVECLARHGARGTRHLDRLVDLAAQFASGADVPSLGGFLAWLDAADRRERGLAPAPEEPDPTAVTVLTVHAAKGLEWDVVAVPGLVEGTFPVHSARVRADADGGWRLGEPTESGWTTGLASLPYDLRGDRDGLPVLPWPTTPDRATLHRSIEQFRLDGGQHGLDEERRLAYVALTRARSRLLLTSHLWGAGQSPRLESRFLAQVCEAVADDSRADIGPALQLPDSREPAVNPRDAATGSVTWPLPADPTGHARRAAEIVGRYREGGRPGGPLARDAALLLEERAAAARREQVVELPQHLSTSALVQLAANPHRFALDLRRPMPSPPAHAARRGTAFHAWVEQHYGRPAMLDLGELPGSADEGAPDDEDLAAMQELFLASDWAGRTPLEVERAVETVVDGIAVRGRIDAVFDRPGGVTIVDWKTGAEPPPGLAATRAVQLSAYRLAYARLTRRSVDEVDACFYYTQTGRTVHPELLDADALRALLPR